MNVSSKSRMSSAALCAPSGSTSASGGGLCVTLGNPTAPQPRDFGCPPDYDAINMMDWEDVLNVIQGTEADGDTEAEEPAPATT